VRRLESAVSLKKVPTSASGIYGWETVKHHSPPVANYVLCSDFLTGILPPRPGVVRCSDPAGAMDRGW